MQQNHNLAYLTSVSKKYLKEATKIKLEVKDYSLLKKEQAIINKFEKALKELESANVVLKDLAIKIEGEKISKSSNESNTEILESLDTEDKKLEKVK
ncbi:hypothetical protein HCA36_03405 [Listeria welshimeri]|nr:hypothetical protein [Listeria welshimeri]